MTTRPSSRQRILMARDAKTDAVVDLIAAAYDIVEQPLPDPDLIADLDDDGWRVLETLTGKRLRDEPDHPRHETRAMIVAKLRSRIAARAAQPADPFDGLDNAAW